MSHDLHAAWATMELAHLFSSQPGKWFAGTSPTTISASATREGTRIWPICDGVVRVETNSRVTDVAVEFKREAEGLHGILTAIGQSQAYLGKGFPASAIVLPESYSSHASPGPTAARIIDLARADLPIAVFTYKPPDSTKSTPFRNQIAEHRLFSFDRLSASAGATARVAQVSTQWGHVREGSFDPHAFFLYLRCAKSLPHEVTAEAYSIDPDLTAAVMRLDPGADVKKYLSYTVSDSFHDRVWRAFWFGHVLTKDVSRLFELGRYPYVVHDVPTEIVTFAGYRKKFFVGRSDSPKNKLVNALNAGSKTLDSAWEHFAENIHSRAHSYREDVDSALGYLGLLDADGKPTDIGYKYVDQVERTGNPNTGIPKLMLGAALLKNADFAALLHYIYRLSAEVFETAPLAFTSGKSVKFDSKEYLIHIEDRMTNDLKVLRKVAPRGGVSRKPFQAELAALAHLDIVPSGKSKGRFRPGVGLNIDWPMMQEYLDFDF